MSESAILEHLLKEGKITQEDIKNAGYAGADSELNGCAELMHSFLCQHEHVYEPDKDTSMYAGKAICLWYIEDVLVDPWTKPAHRLWLRSCLAEMDAQNFSHAHQLRDYLHDLREVLSAIIGLRDRYREGLRLVRQFIESR